MFDKFSVEIGNIVQLPENYSLTIIAVLHHSSMTLVYVKRSFSIQKSFSNQRTSAYKNDTGKYGNI